MSAPREIAELVERFKRNLEDYRSGRYKETQLRLEFIDPLFEALGWDIHNKRGYAEAYKDVIHEDAIKVGGATKAPDYCFRIGGTRKFFVEAKKPSVSIKDAVHPAYQLRRYAWSAKLPLSILTDFEEFAAYDCRVKPARTDKASAARTLYVPFAEYPQRWDEIASIFSREEVLKGSFDKYAESTKRKKGTAEVDSAFLQEIEVWRESLARNIALRNPQLSQRELNFAVQRTIDRIIFLRICEDRGVEHYGQLQALLNGTNVYPRLCQLFYRADERYNSGLFYFRKEKARPDAPDELTPGLTIDDKALKEIIMRLYYPESPYEFSVLPADILGQVYEQFLGKVIRLTAGHRAVVEDKPEVRKAGGVYYTPTYIVDYIVKNTVGRLLEGSGVRGQGSGCGGSGSGKGDENYGVEDVSRPPGLAKGDGPGRSGLHNDGGLSGPGEVRADQPDPESGGLHSGQHRGGLRQDTPGGLSSSSLNCERIPDGGGDVSDVGGASEIREQGASYGGLEPDGTGRQDADEAHRVSEASPNPEPQPLNPKEASRLRILDPACGSGSFLIGAYQYLLDWHLNWYTTHNPEKWARKKNPPIYETRTPYPPNPKPHTLTPNPPSPSYRLTTSERKRILLNNIYGVDIDPQAVEVTKLSLLLKVLEGENEETLERQLKFFHERALPDLGSNIKCGNSLIGPDFYDNQQMTFLDDEERYRINAFDWNAEFPQIMKSGGFDAVIGNPPYIRIQTMQECIPQAADHFRRRYRAAQAGNYDIYVVFVERGLSLLKANARMGFILPSKFFATDYGKGLRQVITGRKALAEVVDFGHAQVFGKSTTYTCLLFLSGEPCESLSYARLHAPPRLAAEGPVFRVISSDTLTPEPWAFATEEEQGIVQKMGRDAVPLADLPSRIGRGSSSGADEVFILAKKGNSLATTRGEPVQIEADILRTPIYATDFGRYSFSPRSDKAIIFPYDLREGGYDLKPEAEMRHMFPGAYEYLSSRKRELEARRQFKAWYGFSAPRNLDVHETAQMLVPLLADRGSYCRLPGKPGGYCLMASAGFSITVGPEKRLSPSYVLGLLNSRLLFWRLRSISNVFRGGWVTCTKQYVATLPIHLVSLSERADKAQHDRIVELVERMLDLHKKVAAAKTDHEKTVLQRQIDPTDRQIDELVYQLYGLTDEETKVVEQPTRRPQNAIK